MIEKNVVLASNSPRRRELFTLCDIPFIVDAASVDEHTDETDPPKVVEELSLKKALAMKDKYPDHVIIGADTIVSVDGRILGKPADEDDAFHMLSLLSGRTHSVYTGVTLLYTGSEGETRDTFHCRTDVTFYELTKEEIRGYIATQEPMDKAGAYGIQGKGCMLVKEIRGDYNNVVGLPVAMLQRHLAQLL